MRRILSTLALVSSLAACSSPTEVEFERVLTLQVAAAKVTCQQWFGPSECLQVRSSAAAPWAPTSVNIEGFVYEPGFEYELRVIEVTLRNPPADGSSIEYRLVRVLKRVPVPPT